MSKEWFSVLSAETFLLLLKLWFQLMCWPNFNISSWSHQVSFEQHTSDWAIFACPQNAVFLCKSFFINLLAFKFIWECNRVKWFSINKKHLKWSNKQCVDFNWEGWRSGLLFVMTYLWWYSSFFKVPCLSMCITDKLWWRASRVMRGESDTASKNGAGLRVSCCRGSRKCRQAKEAFALPL